MSSTEVRHDDNDRLSHDGSWTHATIAATAELTALTTAAERGSVIGFSDLLAGASGAVITLLAGVAANTIGLVGLSVAGAALALLPVIATVCQRRNFKLDRSASVAR